MNLNGKVILITGATGGMGKALAYKLAEHNCKLALFARRKEKLQTIQKDLNKTTTCIYQTCDVTNPDDVIKAVTKTYKTYGCIDLALLSSGILEPNPIETFNADVIIKSMEVNFFGYLYFIEQLLPIMKAQKKGTIAAVSTLPDHRGVPGWGAYGASKAAISWLMESLRAEAYKKYNITCITIKPGSVETPMIEGYHRQGAVTPEQAADAIIRGIKKDKKIIQFPISQVLMVRLSDLFPPFAYDRFPIEAQKGDGYPKVKEAKNPYTKHKK